jgi:GT2 family glycosyltransferase
VTLDELEVVVLTHGTGREVRTLLDALQGQGVPSSRVLVVHNPIQPDAPALELEGRTAEIVRLPSNRGYAGGMNAGLSRLLERNVQRILLLTHDVHLRDGAVPALLAAAEAEPDWGVLGPMLMSPGSEQPFSFGVERSWGGGLAHVRTPPPRGDGVIERDSIDGAAMLLDARALRQTGLLEERFFMYYEEAELCLRVQRAGWRVGVVLDAVAEQETGVSKRPGAFGYLMARNGLEYARLSSGILGVAAGLYRVLYDTAITLLPVVTRRGQLQRWQRDRLAGTWRGIPDFALRRFGPPPGRLTGLGDAKGTSEPIAMAE